VENATRAAGFTGTFPRPQILIGAMPPLLADLVHEAIADLGLELVHDHAELRPAATGQPPVVIVAATPEPWDEWTRELVFTRPETVLLEVERDGRELAVRALYPTRDSLGTLTARRLADAITNVPHWDERFAR
jgi:hypothetical protein